MDKLFGNRLKLLRKNRQLIQVDAAHLIGISYKSLQDHESGRRPNKKNLEKYINFYKCDPNWLLTGTREPSDKVKEETATPVSTEWEHQGEYTSDAGDPILKHFWKAVQGLREIFDSNDPTLIPAIDANILASCFAARREKILKLQSVKLKKLEEECENLKKRIKSLEEHLQNIILK